MMIKRFRGVMFVGLLAALLLCACQPAAASVPAIKPAATINSTFQVTPTTARTSTTTALPTILPSRAPTILATILPSQAQTPTSNLLPPPPGRWIVGDFHTHTWLSDGKHTQVEVVTKAFDKFGLNWLVNADHGGIFYHDPEGKYWNDPSITPAIKIQGDPVKINDDFQIEHPGMWRWQSLLEFSWPVLFGGKDGVGKDRPSLQSKYLDRVLMLGLEWNIPGYDHASVAITNQKDAVEISNFEYQFDAADKDQSRSDLKKQTDSAQAALEGIKYLDSRFSANSYVILNHPSRTQIYTAANLRDLINAGPNVLLGIEGIPGHQKALMRGNYESKFFKDTADQNLDVEKTNRARTYGGADIMLAQVGGVMDSLWGEGRRFWVFVNSDFHSSAAFADFWPGEYTKTYIKVKDLSETGILEGMRSGNVFIVEGDLVNTLDFQAGSGDARSTMGQELTVGKGSDVTITIRFKSPYRNNGGYRVIVNHIDLIAGNVSSQANPNDSAYQSDTNLSTQVIATFTNQDWKTDADGFNTITYTLPAVNKAQYIRLRGTNLGMNVLNQTQNGNPLRDSLIGDNNLAEAYADLWFYSNPIFISVK
jgi:hypothetical protein